MPKPDPVSTCFFAFGLLTAGVGLADKIPCSDTGPQSPRDIGQIEGTNPVTFGKAPPFAEMQLCDIHFHRFAEHRAAGYPTRRGEGQHAGHVCEGTEPGAGKSDRESESGSGCDGVAAGDSVEVHWVFTTCDVEPAPTLNSCFSRGCTNPQLRVEAKVFYLTDGGAGALDFADFADPVDVALPPAAGAVEYLGSTTGPKFDNDTSCSALQVTWNVRPACSPLALVSLDAWCSDNVFRESDAHGVRPLVTPLELRSRID